MLQVFGMWLYSDMEETYAAILKQVAEANKPQPAQAVECKFIHLCCRNYNKSCSVRL